MTHPLNTPQSVVDATLALRAAADAAVEDGWYFTTITVWIAGKAQIQGRGTLPEPDFVAEDGRVFTQDTSGEIVFIAAGPTPVEEAS